MKNKALTLTVIANMTSNYGESLGNISSVQRYSEAEKSTLQEVVRALKTLSVFSRVFMMIYRHQSTEQCKNLLMKM